MQAKAKEHLEAAKSELTKADDYASKRGVEAKKYAKLAQLPEPSLPMALGLLSGYKPYGRGYRIPQVTQIGDYCFCSGFARTAKLTSAVARLPSSCRPEKRLVFNAHTSGTKTIRLDVLANGEIRYSTGNNGTIVSFDGIAFARKDAASQVANLKNGWTAFGAEYREPTLYRQGDLCMLSGVAKLASGAVSSWNNHIVTLPEACRPRDGRLVFSVHSNGYMHRVDVLKSGHVQWVAGERKAPWLSLDGIIFFPLSNGNMSLAEGWSAYGSPYRAQAVVPDAGPRVPAVRSRQDERQPEHCRAPGQVPPGVGHRGAVPQPPRARRAARPDQERPTRLARRHQAGRLARL